jgi:DNA uptake protein ComE-like DNA-binding protein
VLGNIPYVGNRADEIVKIRSELGGFVSIEQIALVKGIGLKNFLRIKPYIRAD